MLFAVACGDPKEAASDVSTTDLVASQDVVAVDDAVEPEDGTPSIDAGDDVAPVNDVVAPLDVAPDVVELFDGFVCECGQDQVFRWGSCVPTLMLGCGASCDGSNPCDEGLECDDCAGSSACGTRDCAAACVVPVAPHALVPDPLRLSPVSVPSTGGEVTISGTSFYIGALGHRVRIGEVFLGYRDSADCELAAIIPPELPDGTHLVEVSQYSGDGPWVVAGIISKGSTPLACVQPGMPCEAANTCCSAGAAQFACEAGRCRASDAAR